MRDSLGDASPRGREANGNFTASAQRSQRTTVMQHSRDSAIRRRGWR